jgi:phosphoenolpyruvate carboxylase
VQDKLQTIALCLAERMEPADLPYLDRPLNVEGKAEQKLRAALTSLWQTDELRASPITVEDEARNALYFSSARSWMSSPGSTTT